MEISIQLIEAFLSVARLQNITKAAKEFYVTQPAMSAYIQELEALLGERLFTRSNRGVALTEFGSKLLAEIDPVYMRFVLSVKDAVSRHIPQENAPLRIGAYHYPDYMTIVKALQEVHAAARLTTPLSCEYYSSSSLRELLLCRELDLVFAPVFEVCTNPDVEVKPIKQMQPYFAIPRAWNVQSSPELAWRSLLLEPDHSRDTFVAICRANGFEPQELRYVSNFLLLAILIENGDGFTVSGQWLPGVNVSNINFIPIKYGGYSSGFDICAAWRKGNKSILEIIALLDTIDFTSLEVSSAITDSKWYLTK